MRLSQLIHVMDGDDWIIVNEGGEGITDMEVYNGKVRWIEKDDPINRRRVLNIFADVYMIVVLIEKGE
jgi:hypothetical protein